ncbi:PLD nuclease N-terminal domain-containing protein [Brevibacterium sp. 50QC2O2]|uniref:PLD nuclease N-terminal domain-containing protein n=1 Tax=Brevibacterium TaxID=1696 RepID=UPI00211D14B3|nr:PLD nuclease N-terminal domain-containing protein [Brevibacterium sp. 68QC2CO]MCQ9389206.1 PLD nuclease N-terminal domain-containing protein [Brevibacterium sp. 50QC2O2]
MARGLIAGVVILVAITLYSLFDCAMRDRTVIRIMPKWGWFFIILFIPLIGLLMWYIFGRGTVAGPGGSAGKPSRRGPIAPDDDPEYLRRIQDDLEQRRRREAHEREERPDADAGDVTKRDDEDR